MRFWFAIAVFLLLPVMTWGQESEVVYSIGKRYVDLKLDKLQSYNKRLSAKQDRLVNRLRKKESRLLKRVERKDSASYALLSNQPVSFDSISKLQRPDSATLSKKNRSGNKVIDSLKSVNSFINRQSDKLGFAHPGANAYSDISNLQQELNYRKYKDELITQRANSLKSAGAKSKLSSFTSVEKKVFYAKQQMKALKEISDEPTKAEEKALEYL